MRNKEYSGAADLFSQAFRLGNRYWAAKVNEGFCYQAMGEFERALAIYDEIDRNCPTPKFRRQALGNSGDILFAMASAASDSQEGDSLVNQGYIKYEAALSAEETFVSLYNLWQAASIQGHEEQEAVLITKLQAHPEFEQLSAHPTKPGTPPEIGGHQNAG